MLPLQSCYHETSVVVRALGGQQVGLRRCPFDTLMVGIAPADSVNHDLVLSRLSGSV